MPRGNRKYPSEVYELIDWAYSDGCTPKEAHRILIDFGVDIPFGTVRYNSPVQRKHQQKYNKKPEVLKRQRGCYKKRMEEKTNSAPRYVLTGDGQSFLELGFVVNRGFEDTKTMNILQLLSGKPANEYEIVEHLRESGIFSFANTCRGPQVSVAKKILRKMEESGWVRPE